MAVNSFITLGFGRHLKLPLLERDKGLAKKSIERHILQKRLTTK
jgi:hypothetical protein